MRLLTQQVLLVLLPKTLKNNHLSKMHLKNHLYYTYKLNRDINIFKQLNEMEKTFSKKSKFSDVIKCHQLDFYEIKNRIQEAYNDINNQCEKYIIGYYNKLNYMLVFYKLYNPNIL